MKGEIYLRPLTVEDAAVSWHWRNDTRLWRFTASHPDRFITEEMEKSWATKAIADKTRLNFAICLKSSNRYIGNIYLVNISGPEGELGIFIGDRECHGKGFAQQALSQLKILARDKYGINRIKISVNSGNAAALIAYLKSGAKFGDESQWLKLVIGTDAKETEKWQSEYNMGLAE